MSIVAEVEALADVPTENGAIGRPVARIAGGFSSSKSAEYFDPTLQLETEAAVRRVGPRRSIVIGVVDARGDPDLIAGLSGRDRGNDFAVCVSPVAAIIGAS